MYTSLGLLVLKSIYFKFNGRDSFYLFQNCGIYKSNIIFKSNSFKWLHKNQLIFHVSSLIFSWIYLIYQKSNSPVIHKKHLVINLFKNPRQFLCTGLWDMYYLISARHLVLNVYCYIHPKLLFQTETQKKLFPRYF